ncbi:MAG: hypothetical protein ACE5FG_00940 [Myxococcota bacterium]
MATRAHLRLNVLTMLWCMMLLTAARAELTVSPPHARVGDTIRVTVTGAFGVPCFHLFSSHEVTDQEITVHVGLVRFGLYGCIQVVTPWSVTEEIAPLPVGRYRVRALLFEPCCSRCSVSPCIVGESSLTVSVVPAEFVPGDINDDGRLDVLDASVLRRALVDLGPGITQQCVLQCGNGILDPGEECELGTLRGASCHDLGFSGGTLACTPGSCSYDVSACIPPLCDPLDPEPVCGPDRHCFPEPDGVALCGGSTGAGTQGSPCTLPFHDDCATGFTCVDLQGSAECQQLCPLFRPDTCPASTSCTPLSFPLFAGIQEYGLCR